MFVTKSTASHTRGILLLLATTLIWGTTFPLSKEALTSLSPMVLIAVRFAIAALVFVPWLRHLNRTLLRDGVLLGVVYLVSYITLTLGVEAIAASRAAFILSLNVILVPLFGRLLGRSLPIVAIMAAILAIAGVGVLSWDGSGLDAGDLWVLGGAVSYAVYILLLEGATARHAPMTLAGVQLTFAAGVSMLWAAPAVWAELPTIAAHFQTLLYLGLVVTAATTWTQAVAQQWVSAHETALLYTLEPVFASVFSFWLLGEQFGARGLMGAGLVLAATVLSQSQSVLAAWLKRTKPPKALTPL